MNVATLRQILASLDGKARILLHAPANPTMGGQCSGHLLHIAISRLDGIDNTVSLCTCRATDSPDGELSFEGEPTIQTASASTERGHEAARQQLEQNFSEVPARPVSTYLEARQMREAFQRLNNLIGGEPSHG